jgi:hypothetical protein
MSDACAVRFHEHGMSVYMRVGSFIRLHMIHFLSRDAHFKIKKTLTIQFACVKMHARTLESWFMHQMDQMFVSSSALLVSPRKPYFSVRTVTKKIDYSNELGLLVWDNGTIMRVWI